MPVTAATHWFCLTCGEAGSYVEPDTKSDTGAAAKHGHATLTSTTQAAALRMAKVAR
jgi:hypothetical protein